MSLLPVFERYIKEHHLFSKNEKLILALSGGVDSVVLLHLCKAAGFDVLAAHCNFHLRAEESDRDEAFCRNLATEYHYPIVVKHFNTEDEAKGNHQSIQVTARELRYAWFEELVKEEKPGGARIITAHHLDDSIETSVMNFFKGSGIAGIRGILPLHGHIARPLLFASKEQIIAYAKEQGLSWVEDSTNASEKYTRNYFRLQVLPTIEKVYPQAYQNLANNLQRFRDTELFYQETIDSYRKKLLESKGEAIHIPVLKVKKIPGFRTLLFELFRPYGFSTGQVADLVSLLDAQSGKYVESSTHRVLRNRAWLILSPKQTETPTHILIEGEGKVSIPGGELSVTYSSGELKDNDPWTAQLNPKGLTFPLILRRWKNGDYFYPLGMKKKKKLARFFIDQKLSKLQKENAWVLECDKKIVWVVGWRIDERFKVVDKGGGCVELKIKK